jgi:hypothetical protein
MPLHSFRKGLLGGRWLICTLGTGAVLQKVVPARTAAWGSPVAVPVMCPLPQRGRPVKRASCSYVDFHRSGL